MLTKLILKLYVTGQTPNSIKAIVHSNKILEEERIEGPSEQVILDAIASSINHFFPPLYMASYRAFQGLCSPHKF